MVVVVVVAITEVVVVAITEVVMMTVVAVKAGGGDGRGRLDNAIE